MHEGRLQAPGIDHEFRRRGRVVVIVVVIITILRRRMAVVDVETVADDKLR